MRYLIILYIGLLLPGLCFAQGTRKLLVMSTTGGNAQLINEGSLQVDMDNVFNNSNFVRTSSATANYIPIFSNSNTLINSSLSETGGVLSTGSTFSAPFANFAVANLSAYMNLNGTADEFRSMNFRTGTSIRWSFYVQGNETGSNAGSNFSLSRYGDAANYLGVVFNINRANGYMKVGTSEIATRPLDVAGGAIFTENVQGKSFTSTELTGTSPFIVASTTRVDNLNVSRLDGLTKSDFVDETEFSAGRPQITPSTGSTTNVDFLNTYSNFQSVVYPNAGTLTLTFSNMKAGGYYFIELSGTVGEGYATVNLSDGSSNIATIYAKSYTTVIIRALSSSVYSVLTPSITASTYEAKTVPAQTSGVNNKHQITLDCNYYTLKTFRVNLVNTTSAGTEITLTNMKAGGSYTINYYNGGGYNTDYITAKTQDGSTDFGTFQITGATTHRLSYDGTNAIKAF